MNAEILAACVLEARELLRGWRGEEPAAQLIRDIQLLLEPLRTFHDHLPDPIVRKLDQIGPWLPKLGSDEASLADLEAIEILLLGIWIRLEALKHEAHPPSRQITRT